MKLQFLMSMLADHNSAPSVSAVYPMNEQFLVKTRPRSIWLQFEKLHPAMSWFGPFVASDENFRFPPLMSRKLHPYRSTVSMSVSL